MASHEPDFSRLPEENGEQAEICTGQWRRSVWLQWDLGTEPEKLRREVWAHLIMKLNAWNMFI